MLKEKIIFSKEGKGITTHDEFSVLQAKTIKSKVNSENENYGFGLLFSEKKGLYK